MASEVASMTGDVESVALEHLGRFAATLGCIERRLDEQSSRLADLESGSAVALGYLAHLSAARVARRHAIENVSRRLDRIERRLELTH